MRGFLDHANPSSFHRRCPDGSECHRRGSGPFRRADSHHLHRRAHAAPVHRSPRIHRRAKRRRPADDSQVLLSRDGARARHPHFGSRRGWHRRRRRIGGARATLRRREEDAPRGHAGALAEAARRNRHGEWPPGPRSHVPPEAPRRRRHDLSVVHGRARSRHRCAVRRGPGVRRRRRHRPRRDSRGDRWRHSGRRMPWPRRVRARKAPRTIR